ncbi:hypothetical protein B0H15DRAFT_1023347 [Mycena belliarum]|uniref:Uncharacterized protein n=1 Tax=Mycena belliarum TaxID=1033014 RepID=A0AAD6U5R7_9AGAR|nr:hypothetical protein B0H15DRAFT_1023347 [Mycena belliae]
MFFAASFVSAAFSMISIGVSAIPTEDVSARAVCPAGQFPDSTAAVPGTCTPCPAGNTCDGSSNVQPCDYGRFQPSPGSTTCLPTPAGSYQPQRGQTAALPCYVGSYQPYPGQAFCYGAPSGRFQGHTGQAGVCGACCGWAATQSNFNTAVTQCVAPTPFSGRASGSGCVSTMQGCTPVATCDQVLVGTVWTCPDQTFN